MSLNKAFEAAHKEGAEKFGFLWIEANEVAIEIAIEFKIKSKLSEAQFKAFLSVLTLKILEKAKE